MIDQKGAIMYASQLVNLLHEHADPTLVLGNPLTRAALISLARDLAHEIPGAVGEELRKRIGDLRVPMLSEIR